MTLECIACNNAQEKASVINTDPVVMYCCEPMSAYVTSLLKSVNPELSATGRCYFCDCWLGEFAVFGVWCDRQSCLLWRMNSSPSSAPPFPGSIFAIRPCAWSARNGLPLTTKWSASVLSELPYPPYPQLTASQRRILESVALEIDCSNVPVSRDEDSDMSSDEGSGSECTQWTSDN